MTPEVARALSGINTDTPVKIYKKTAILEPEGVVEAANVMPYNCTTQRNLGGLRFLSLLTKAQMGEPIH